MTIALVADLHGNMTAVQALERDLIKRKADAVWCLGDLVGKGPSSDRTFDWAVANCDLILRGNWDEGVGMKLFPNDAFYYDQLGKARLEKLCGFPLEHHARLSGRNIRLIHGRPIMKDLINRTLQERRINSHHRTKTAKCQSCRKSHRMLFCYSHIE